MTDREIAAQVIDDLTRALDTANKRADEWRACADQLAAAINNGFGAHITTPAGEALAEYERLAGDP